MTDKQLADIKLTIEALAKTAGSLGTLFAPQAAAYIALGQIVAANAPELLEDIVKLLEGKQPTTEEIKALDDKTVALLSPENIQ